MLLKFVLFNFHYNRKFLKERKLTQRMVKLQPLMRKKMIKWYLKRNRIMWKRMVMLNQKRVQRRKRKKPRKKLKRKRKVIRLI